MGFPKKLFLSELDAFFKRKNPKNPILGVKQNLRQKADILNGFSIKITFRW